MKVDFVWAVNKFKLEQAVAEVRGDNPITSEIGTNEIVESKVREVYIRLKGLVVEPDTAPVIFDEPVAVQEVTEPETVPQHTAPTRRKSRKSK